MKKTFSFARLLCLLAVAALAAPLAASIPTSSQGGLLGRPSLHLVADQKLIAESKAYKLATEGLLAYFRDVLMKTQEFKDTFGEDVLWEEIAANVLDSVDISRDEKEEHSRYADRFYAFTGRVFDLYAEIAIDKVSGAVKDALIELDD